MRHFVQSLQNNAQGLSEQCCEANKKGRALVWTAACRLQPALLGKCPGPGDAALLANAQVSLCPNSARQCTGSV